MPTARYHIWTFHLNWLENISMCNTILSPFAVDTNQPSTRKDVSMYPCGVVRSYWLTFIFIRWAYPICDSSTHWKVSSKSHNTDAVHPEDKLRHTNNNKFKNVRTHPLPVSKLSQQQWVATNKPPRNAPSQRERVDDEPCLVEPSASGVWSAVEELPVTFRNKRIFQLRIVTGGNILDYRSTDRDFSIVST